MADKITGETLIQSAIPSVADKLTQGWNMISPMQPLPPRRDMEKMARTLLTEKKLEVNGREVVNLDENSPNGISKEDKKLISAQSGLDLEGLEAIADKAKRDKLAAAVDKGVQSQDNWLTKIGNFLSGLMNWIFSGFKGGFAGLWEQVGAVSAQGVKSAVNESVSVAMKNDPDLKVFSSYMPQINKGIESKVMEIATGVPEEKRSGKRPEVTPLPADQENVKRKVQTEVAKSVYKAKENGALNSNLNSLFDITIKENASRPSLKDTHVSEFKEQVAGFVIRVANDPKLDFGGKKAADMSLDEFRATMKQEMVKQLDGMKLSAYDGKQQSLTQWYDDHWAGDKGWYISTKRYAAELPSQASQISENLAARVMDPEKLTDEQLAQLKNARSMAENGYVVGIEERIAHLKDSKLKTALTATPPAPKPEAEVRQPDNGFTPTAAGPSLPPSAGRTAAN